MNITTENNFSLWFNVRFSVHRLNPKFDNPCYVQTKTFPVGEPKLWQIAIMLEDSISEAFQWNSYSLPLAQRILFLQKNGILSDETKYIKL